MSFENIHKTTGFIHRNNSFVGSAILFPWKDELCAITAGHNFYGRDFAHEPNVNEWQVVDHLGNSYPITTIVCDVAFAKSHDIVLVKAACDSASADFVCPKFCSIPKNPRHSLLFRGRYKGSASAVTRRSITYNSTVAGMSDHHFLCDIDKALLMDDSYRSGSDWLGGWSGSGLFIDHHQELICAGILCEIPNKGNDGQLLFSSLGALNLVGIDLDIMPASDLDFNNSLNAASLTAILRSVTEQAVDEWETTNHDSPQLGFLNRKLIEIYPVESIQFNKRRIIKQLLTGKSYLTAELSKKEHLMDLYRNAYQVYDLEGKQFYVNSKPDALAQLSLIKNEYERYLSESIGRDFSAIDVKLLASYGVSEWIADCSLDFLPNGQ
jgi:hypothetical protein